MVTLRPVREEEFPAWVRTIVGTYGDDRTDAQITGIDRGEVELDRSLGVFDGDAIAGGAAVCTRQLTVPGAVVPVAGIDWVGVAPTHRRRGILTALMRRQLDDVHEAGAEPVAALYAAESAIYGRFGYGLATMGAEWRVDKRAAVFRPDVDFGAGTLRFASRDEAAPVLERLFDTARAEVPGWLDRTPSGWRYRLSDDENVREGATSYRYVLHEEPGGAPSGYALYRLKTGTAVKVAEVVALTRQAYVSLWRFLTGIDLHPELEYEAALDEPLPHLLTDARAVTATVHDRVWVRLVDVPRALAARRYSVPLNVVLEVADAFCPWNAGRYWLTLLARTCRARGRLTGPTCVFPPPNWARCIWAGRRWPPWLRPGGSRR